MTRAGSVLFLVVLAIGCGGKTETAPTSSVPFSQVDLIVGTGTLAENGRTVTVTYGLWLYDASKPDGKGTQIPQPGPFSFPLGVGSVIRGWDQGVPGMRVGGQRRLIIPPELAYGNRSPGGGIPANATLLFDITLTAVQ